jgi:tRNA-modifying protein YgfZ
MRRVAEIAGGPAMPGYEALRAGAVLFDRSDRGRWRFTGPKAAETLTGLVTNDVLALQAGDGLYAAALTPKGKIVADLRIFRDGDEFLVDTGAAAAPGWRAMARKYINPRVAPFGETTTVTADVGMFGAGAAQLISRAIEDGGCALEQLRPYAHARVRFKRDGGEALVVRAVELGEIPGFDIITSAESAEAIRAELESLGATAASAEVYAVARIEAGFPEWGVDMNEDTLAQEANLDELGAISYSKGCYIGQEVVARIHFRGHVNRTLRRITFDADKVPPRGAELMDASGKTVGDTRSAAVSPRAGGVAIAMVRREVEAGAELTAQWGDSSAPVVVR